MKTLLAALIGALLTGSISGSALPNYSTSGTCTSGQLGVISPGTSCSQTDGYGYDNLTLAVAPFAGLSADAAVAGGAPDSFGVTGALNYAVEIVGGNPGDQVPLLILINLFTSVSATGGNGYAFAEVLATTDLMTNAGQVSCSSTEGSCPGGSPASFSDTFGVSGSSGSIGTIHIELDILAAPVLSAGETVSAIADPYIYVDPSFAGAANYSVLLSPGVANATASTPEPGAVVLVGCGAILLFSLRRSRPL